MTKEWESMNFKQHHNEAYVISRLPKQTQDDLNGLLTMVAMTGSYKFQPEELPSNKLEEFAFQWKNGEGSFEINVTLSDDKHELADFMFVGLLGHTLHPQEAIRYGVKGNKMSPSQIIEIAKNYA